MTRRRRAAIVAVVVGLLFALLGLPTAAAATTPVSIFDSAPVGARAEVFDDPSRTMTAEEVARGAPFRPLEPAQANRGYTAAAIWVRFTLENPAPGPETAIIEVAATPSRADLYDAEGKLLARSGALLPFDARPVRHSNIAFRSVLAAGERRTFLVVLESRDTMIVNPIIWREEAFWRSVQRLRLLDGIYYGIILGLALYNLFLAFATRERAYLAYVVFQVAMATANAAIDKYTFAFLWPHHPIWAERSEQVFNMIALAAAMQCARWLLDTPKLAPRIDRVLRVVALVAAVVGLGAVMLEPTPVLLFGDAAISFLGITLLVVAASLVARTGSPHGKIFLVAWSVLFAATFAAGLSAVGGVQSLEGFDLLKIGAAVEALLLSIGLAARIRTMQRDRARAQEDILVERARRIDSLSRLVAGVAHEIGNPLNFAKGGAGALGAALDSLTASAAPSAAATKTATSARRALGLVESGLERIGRLIGHLRADLGDRQAHATALDLGRELDDALEVLALAERKVVVVREGKEPLLVVSRSGDLAQVFANLARNAADAMPDGGTLTITCRRKAGDAVVVFHDQGPGVAAELHASIFEPFFTTRAAGAAPPGSDVGTGLGLYVSREIVTRWSGTLSLAPSGEGGATFIVRLPLALTPA